MFITQLISTFESIVTTLAIIVGGLWAYFNFFRGRTYKPRLEFNIDGSLTHRKQEDVLFISIIAKNIGLSHVPIQQYGSGLRLEKLTISDGESLPKRALIGTYAVFEKHSWIEPSEAISEEQVLVANSLEESTLGYRVTLRVVTTRSKAAWEQHKIIVRRIAP
jgi:hypothetical protein